MARLAPARRQAADLRADLAQRGRGQQRLTHHLLPPALPPEAHRARQAAVPASARAVPCEAATKADRGATARACLTPAREPLRSADGTPRGRRRKLVTSAARRARPPRLGLGLGLRLGLGSGSGLGFGFGFGLGLGLGVGVGLGLGVG